MCQGFIHRRETIRHADDSLAVAESLVECLSQYQCDVVNCMVSVHLKIPLRLYGKIEQSVNREMRQHMVQEPDASGNLMLADAVQIQFDFDLCLIRLA